jgi:hypothetical protein
VLSFHLGVSASYLGFENPDPPIFSHTGPLWGLLFLATPLGIGYFATRVVERNAVPDPTEAQKAELDRRLSEHVANPDEVVPWSDVMDSALTRIRR